LFDCLFRAVAGQSTDRRRDLGLIRHLANDAPSSPDSPKTSLARRIMGNVFRGARRSKSATNSRESSPVKLESTLIDSLYFAINGSRKQKQTYKNTNLAKLNYTVSQKKNVICYNLVRCRPISQIRSDASL